MMDFGAVRFSRIDEEANRVVQPEAAKRRTRQCPEGLREAGLECVSKGGTRDVTRSARWILGKGVGSKGGVVVVCIGLVGEAASPGQMVVERYGSLV